MVRQVSGVVDRVAALGRVPAPAVAAGKRVGVAAGHDRLQREAVDALEDDVRRRGPGRAALVVDLDHRVGGDVPGARAAVVLRAPGDGVLRAPGDGVLRAPGDGVLRAPGDG